MRSVLVRRSLGRTIVTVIAAMVVGCDGGPARPGDVGAEQTGEAESGLTAVTVAVSSDAHVRLGQPNTSFGAMTFLAAGSDGAARALVRFDPAAIGAGSNGLGAVASASLDLTIATNGNAAAQVQTFDVHAVTQAWTELGATWSCATDSDTTNTVRDCSGATRWTMGSLVSVPVTPPWAAVKTASFTVASGQTGTVSVDVTADVNALLAGGTLEGWIVMRPLGSGAGFVSFGAREGATPPVLRVTPLGCAAGQHDGGDGACVATGTCSPGFGDCNAIDHCEALDSPDRCGSCQTSCDDGNPCTDDTCTASLACAHADASDGAACNAFGGACSVGGTCQSGACVGGQPGCMAIDGCHLAGVCNPATGQCTTPLAPNGTPCDDGNTCTSGDACLAGVCAGAPGGSCPPPDPCQSAACDAVTGQCVSSPLPDGSPCNDGDACTDPDACQSGKCVGTLPVACLQAAAGEVAAPAAPAAGCTPPTCCDPTLANEPTLVVTRATSPTALGRFELTDVLSQIIALASIPNTTPLTLFQRWFDTQNPASTAAFPTGPHCSDNGATINGFPVECPRPEGVLATTGDPFNVSVGGAVNKSYMRPVALFNRFDLAHTDGATCGEYRIAFAKASGDQSAVDRLTLNFEAVLPNPNPGCGLDGCRAVAEFWAGLSQITDPVQLADELERFYYVGLPGFRPVIHPANFGMTGDAAVCGAGTGQVRTNQFIVPTATSPTTAPFKWQLREFKLARQCTGGAYDLVFQPVTVKTNPWGGLFAAGQPAPAAAFQTDFLEEVAALSATTVADISMATSPVYDAGQSTETGTENDYRIQLGQNNPFATSISAKVLSLFGSATLTAANIVDRATTQSCAGCHQLSNNRSLGGGLIWPSSLGFVHVNEAGQLSTALTAHFLPKRMTRLGEYLSCNGSATPGSACTGP